MKSKVWAVTTPEGELFLFADETDAHRYGWRHGVDPVEHAVEMPEYRPQGGPRRIRFTRGTCSICYQEYPLRDDGTVRKHFAGARGTPHCIGSTYPPAPKPTSGRTP